MRHVYTNRVVVLIAAMLMAMAVLFAWLRSRPEPIHPDWPEISVDTSDAPPATAPVIPDWLEVGQRTYTASCSSCHTAETPDQFVSTTLHTRTRAMAVTEEGRAYLIKFMLYGARGQIMVDGAPRRLRHRPYGQLSDEEVAAVLNLMLADSSAGALPDHLFQPDEITAWRAHELTAEQVAASRPDPASQAQP